MNNKAVLYLRLSKEDRNKVNKGDDSESIINQRIMLSDYAMRLKSVYLIATRDLSNLWLQFFLSQNQGFMRLFEKTVLK